MIEGWLPGDGSGESGNTGKLTDSVHALSLARVENSHDGELNEDSSQSKGTQIAREESEEEEYSDEVEKPKGKEWTTKGTKLLLPTIIAENYAVICVKSETVWYQATNQVGG